MFCLSVLDPDSETELLWVHVTLPLLQSAFHYGQSLPAALFPTLSFVFLFLHV